jgi:hypothetical protein
MRSLFLNGVFCERGVRADVKLSVVGVACEFIANA